MQRPVAERAFKPVLLAQRTALGDVVPVVDHRRFVIDGEVWHVSRCRLVTSWGWSSSQGFGWSSLSGSQSGSSCSGRHAAHTFYCRPARAPSTGRSAQCSSAGIQDSQTTKRSLSIMPPQRERPTDPYALCCRAGLKEQFSV